MCSQSVMTDCFVNSRRQPEEKYPFQHRHLLTNLQDKIISKMHSVELHEMMPRSQLIPKTIRHSNSMDLDQLDDIVAGNYGGRHSVNPVECWNSSDIANWLLRVSHRIEVDCTMLCGEKFVHLSGTTLLNMTENEFTDITPEFGKELYLSIKQHQMESTPNILTPACSNFLTHPDIIKPVEQWDTSDVIDWLLRTSKDINVDYVDLCGEKFVRMSGSDLLNMKEGDFLAITPEHGKQLYGSIQYAQMGGSNIPPWPSNDVLDLDRGLEMSMPSYEDANGSDSENSRPPSVVSSLSKPARADQFTPSGPVQKRKRGRPSNPNKKGKKKQENSFGRLWEFLRDLLKNPDTCPRIIKWENHDDGLFRFVQSDEVAKIWGRRKGNKQMTYEKLSRAMRSNYGTKKKRHNGSPTDVVLDEGEKPKRQYLMSNKKRLVYKFGPDATGWKVEDPNFEKRNSITFEDWLTSLTLDSLSITQTNSQSTKVSPKNE